jgi:acyl-CoA synthetase (NDP forming)
VAERERAILALDQICNARSVAVVGASNDPGKFGYSLLDTLQRGGYDGEIYPINPKAERIQGLRAYASIRDVPGHLDLALVVIPAPQVPQVLCEAAEKGIQRAVIYSAGYRELGHPERETELKAIAQKHGLHFLGPNIQGIIYVPNKLSAMFWPAITTQGPLAVVTQSGSVTAGLVEWAVNDGLGISAAVNLGNQVDLCDSDVLEYLGQDRHTQAIALYLEGVKDGRRFMDTVSRVAQNKPVVLLKAGRTDGGRRSAASHTGSLAGSDEAFTAACRQFGAVRADDMESLYDAAKALATIRDIRGRRVCIVSSSGGGNTLAADEADRQGLVIPPLPPACVEKLAEIGLPPNAHLTNPLDLGGVKAAHYEQAVILADQFDVADVYLLAFCDPVPGSTELTQRLASRIHAKVVATYFGGGEIEKVSRVEIQAAGIPVFPSPERAMRGIAAAVWAAERRQWNNAA